MLWPYMAISDEYVLPRIKSTGKPTNLLVNRDLTESLTPEGDVFSTPR